MRMHVSVGLFVTLAGGLSLAGALAPEGFAAAPPPLVPPVGGANSPPPSPRPELVIETAEIDCGTFSVKVPTGTYAAPPGGAADYAVPAPIVAFKGPDGLWRGHGYLETTHRLTRFEAVTGTAGAVGEGRTAHRLRYEFEGGKSYTVELAAADGAVLLTETSDLGPRNRWVFDCHYDWQPAAGFAVDPHGRHHAFLYLPCYYDRPEVTVNPVAQSRPAPGEDVPPTKHPPGGVAVTCADPAATDVAGFWVRDLASWTGGQTMGFQLWQRRQTPGDPSSRHFLGPETKSDSTPNPRTAPMLGRSLYEGHVTIEFDLGVGTRKLGFAVTGKGETKGAVPEAFKRAVRANR